MKLFEGQDEKGNINDFALELQSHPLGRSVVDVSEYK